MNAYHSLASDLHSSIKNYHRATETRVRLLEWAHEQQSALMALGELRVDTCGLYIDFNNPTSEQKYAILKAFPGKWNKRYEGVQLSYMLEDSPIEPFSLRIFNAPLPPSCKIVKRTRVDAACEERVVEYNEIVCDNKEQDEQT